MAKSQIDPKGLIDAYCKLRNALEKKDYAAFSSTIEAPEGQKMPKEEFTDDNIEMLLGMLPDPKNFKSLGAKEEKDDCGYLFRFAKADEEGSYFYGTIFFHKTKEGPKFTRILLKNVDGKGEKDIDKLALEQIENDPDFALDQKKALKMRKEAREAAQMEKETAQITMKNEYENGWTPSISMVPPKNWFDMNSSGNSNQGEFETLTIGGLGFSKSGEPDYSTKKKFQFAYCKSNKSIDEFAQTLQSSKYTISKKTKTGFIATRKDDFWGNQYQQVEKTQGGFLVGLVDGKEKGDYEEAVKMLQNLMPTVKLRF
ncbi:hypothetical protein HY990_06800 [Candidatus Micrarchaeota archaeon]|nr:hypothetical protein [Candidatus Micrarchaeota archaeon]